MAAIAASGADRSRLFEYASQFHSASGRYFREVLLLVDKLGYDYAEGCRIVGESAKEEQVRGFLLRFSAALSSGESEEDFLAREARFQSEVYSNKYQRELESLWAWTLAWVGLIISTTLIIIVALLSAMIFPAGSDVIIFVVVIMAAMIVITFFGAWFIYRLAPHEVKFYPARQESSEQQREFKAFRLLIPLAIVVAVILLALGVDSWIAILVLGITVFPIGLISFSIDRRIDGREGEVGTFFRSLGGITSAVGTTVREGLDRLDKKSMPFLLPSINKLCYRLGLGLKPDLCWERFAAETGSETVRRSSEMFYQAAELGGEADRIGEQTSFYATTTSLLRERRRLISSTFRWLSIGTHAMSVALLVFVVHMVVYFGSVVESLEEKVEVEAARGYLAGITGDIFLFNFSVAESFPKMIVPAVFVLSLVNAFTPHTTEGGHWHKVFFYLGITLVISAILLWTMPPLAHWLFERVEID